MTHPYWPLWDLRLRVGEVDLRPMTEADLVPLADLLPDDVELDPDATRYPGLPEATNRRVIGFQRYWNGYGSWRPEQWQLGFCVRAGGELVGVQELAADDFPLLRTVDSASHLVPAVRGRGIGRQMRRAILALAFGPLRAQAAITSAWHDNYASLAVSRALGYQPNGESLHRRGDQVDTLQHLRLPRSDWLAGDGAAGVRIEGMDGCWPYFGIEPR
ncbi:GNAT family N-acetyltransferase [Jatrophihabitans sp.]|jgi:RimJ/RimL family protein N-acetyltransferase|uniref:GNAT family N-acetyltransferase n=1 Tax=Jatrophihabitans sp. TaxID=1932789 RepID=UPI002F212F05